MDYVWSWFWTSDEPDNNDTVDSDKPTSAPVEPKPKPTRRITYDDVIKELKACLLRRQTDD